MMMGEREQRQAEQIEEWSKQIDMLTAGILRAFLEMEYANVGVPERQVLRYERLIRRSVTVAIAHIESMLEKGVAKLVSAS